MKIHPVNNRANLDIHSLLLCSGLCVGHKCHATQLAIYLRQVGRGSNSRPHATDYFVYQGHICKCKYQGYM